MNVLKKIVKGYLNTSLILRILIGLAIGIFFGLVLPQAKFIALFGSILVGALKGIAPILVFILVLSSLSTAGRNIGKRFATVIGLYMLSTFLAATFATIISFIFKVTIPIESTSEIASAPEGLYEVFSTLLNNMVQNPVAAIMNGNYVGILTWSVIIGLALRALAKENTKNALKDFSDSVSKVVGWIIQVAPFGIMGLVFSSVGEYGIGIFADYGKLLLVLVGCMLIVFLVIDPLIIFLCLKKNPYPLVLKCFKDSGISAFFTRSSAANIPVNMALCKRLGLDEDFYSVAIPLGATINMDGAAITITVMSLCAAFSCGIEVNFFLAILLSFVATLGACGASGVAGGSLLLIPMACSLLNVPVDIAMAMVGIGFIIGVVQDSLETAINSSGDVMFAATAEYIEWKKQGRTVDFKDVVPCEEPTEVVE